MSSNHPPIHVGTTGDPPSKRRKLSHRQPHPRLRTEKRPNPSQARKTKMEQGSRRRVKPQPPREIRPVDIHGYTRPRAHLTKPVKPVPSSSASNAISTSRVSSATPSTTPDPNTDTNTKLSTTKSLLDQIWARNKNQHRAQSCWKFLGMLRKTITRIVAMNEAEHSLRLQSHKVTNAKEVRQRFEQETQIRREREAVFDWIREVLVPRAYVGFTALVGDSQFAALGVVLVGILADVMSVVGAPKHMENAGGEQVLSKGKVSSKEQGVARSLAATSIRITGLQSGEVVERMYDSDDLGEVVERTKPETSKGHALSMAPQDAGAGAAEDGPVVHMEDTMDIDTGRSTKTSDTGLQLQHTAGEDAVPKTDSSGPRHTKTKAPSQSPAPAPKAANHYPSLIPSSPVESGSRIFLDKQLQDRNPKLDQTQNENQKAKEKGRERKKEKQKQDHKISERVNSTGAQDRRIQDSNRRVQTQKRRKAEPHGSESFASKTTKIHSARETSPNPTPDMKEPHILKQNEQHKEATGLPKQQQPNTKATDTKSPRDTTSTKDAKPQAAQEKKDQKSKPKSKSKSKKNPIDDMFAGFL